MGKDNDSNKDPGMKDYKVWHAEKLRRESGYEKNTDDKAMSDPLPFDKHREMEERDGIYVPPVASKRMSLSEVNALIDAYRQGDENAAGTLYKEYKKVIRKIIYKNKWAIEFGFIQRKIRIREKEEELDTGETESEEKEKEIKELHIDEIESEVWVVLFDLFKKEYVTDSVPAIARKIIERKCRDEGIKEKRHKLVKGGEILRDEPDLDANGKPKKLSNAQKKIRDQINLYRKFLWRFFNERDSLKVEERVLNMRISLKDLIAKCFPKNKEKAQKIFFKYVVSGETMEEIGRQFNVSHVTIMNYIRLLKIELKECFAENGVLIIKDIL